jgi:pSer/pThr/pTyr-binding forkhead associated (FHA) protein
MLDEPEQQTTIQDTVSVARVTKQIRPHLLEQIRGPGAPARWELVQDSAVLGREIGADIPLPGDQCSRRHALLRRRNHEYAIVDLDSVHGIYLNGIKVHSAVLRDDDIVQLGDVVFLYHEG